MKLTINLSEEDVAALDQFAKAAGLASRSAAVHHAIRLLGDPESTDAYAAAWDEWEASGEAADWDSTLGDGLFDASQCRGPGNRASRL